jgi:predicted dehydrogenase
MNNSYTWAIVGLGRIGSSLEGDPLREKPASHAGAIAASSASLTAGCDIDPVKCKDFGNQWAHLDPVPKLYRSCKEMLRMESPDIISIATPPETHLDLVRQAVSFRIPIVVCEKPLAWKLSEARAIRRLIDKGSTRMVVNHERRFSADYRMAKEAVLQQRYGSLLSITASLYFGKKASHRDVLIHDGTHMLDCINFLTDSHFKAIKRTGRPDDNKSSLMILGYAGKCPVALEVGGERDHLLFRLSLSFEEGAIEIGNGIFNFYRSVESPYYSGFRSLVSDTVPWFPRTAYFSGMAEEALRLAAEPSAQSASSASDGLAVLQAIDTL